MWVFFTRSSNFLKKLINKFDQTKVWFRRRIALDAKVFIKMCLWQFWHRIVVKLFASIRWILESRCRLFVDRIFTLEKDKIGKFSSV